MSRCAILAQSEAWHNERSRCRKLESYLEQIAVEAEAKVRFELRLAACFTPCHVVAMVIARRMHE